MHVVNLHWHLDERAVSQVIAALLLIAIAVAAAILLYVFSIGLIGSLGSGGGQQTKEQIIMEAYNFQTSSLLINLRNVGTASVDLGGADYFLNGVQLGTPGGSCAATLAPSDHSTATLSPNTASLVSGAAHPLKIVTPSGGVFAYTVTYGGSS